jgi:tRNA nucleotidyltransferase (CCA-adding enzyme)
MLTRIPFEIARLLATLENAGHNALLAGGCVRDLTLGCRPQDYDIEIIGEDISEDSVVSLLRSNNLRAWECGKDFNVIEIHGLENGHKAQVSISNTSTVYGAATRRDFTINALYANRTGDVIDPTSSGLAHLKVSALHPVSYNTFSGDPLRIFRAMQLAGRYDLRPSDQAVLLAKHEIKSVQKLPVDRIAEEWMKWARLSAVPSKGIDFLRDCGILDSMYPELGNLVDTVQNPVYHPEGSAYVHTMKVIDFLAKLDRTPTHIMFAGLLHDTGKADTTVLNEYRNYVSPGHSDFSVRHTKNFLKKIRYPESERVLVLNLVKHHMLRIEDMGIPATKRTAVKLSPASLHDYLLLRAGDRAGQNIPLDVVNEEYREGEEKALEAEALLRKPDRILMGRHLLQEKLMEPGKRMGEVLDLVYEQQIEGKIETVKEGLQLAELILRERKWI